jgi:alpha-tubulin suppressor-like RCC1 family protein
MFDPTSISHIEVNTDYNVALTDDGKVYSWGFGQKGKLGSGGIDSLTYPIKVNFGNPKKQGTKGKKNDDFEFEQEYDKIKDAKKKITKFGNEEDLLGMHNFIQGFMKKKDHIDRTFFLGSQNERRYSEEEFFDLDAFEEDFPEEVINYEQVKVVSKEALHANLLLSNIEKVYVTQISCSDHHTLVCTNSGSVYGWGSNEYCQLGFENKDTGKNYVFHPKKIFGSLKKHFIERVAAGKNHSLALSNDGVAHGWGDNTYSQIGMSKIEFPVVYRPSELKCIT